MFATVSCQLEQDNKNKKKQHPDSKAHQQGLNGTGTRAETEPNSNFLTEHREPNILVLFKHGPTANQPPRTEHVTVLVPVVDVIVLMVQVCSSDPISVSSFPGVSRRFYGPLHLGDNAVQSEGRWMG